MNAASSGPPGAPPLNGICDTVTFFCCISIVFFSCISIVVLYSICVLYLYSMCTVLRGLWMEYVTRWHFHNDQSLPLSPHFRPTTYSATFILKIETWRLALCVAEIIGHGILWKNLLQLFKHRFIGLSHSLSCFISSKLLWFNYEPF